MKIILGAALTRYPFVAGSVWNRLHRVIGLQRLGHEVVFVEELKPAQVVDRAGRPCAYADSINRRWFAEITERFGGRGSACQVWQRGAETTGMSFEQLKSVARETDLLLNMSGHIATPAILEAVRRRVYLDEDPVYTQLWKAVHGCDLNLDCHEILFSVGQNIGTPASPIPDCGRTWRHFLPPVVPELWPDPLPAAGRRFTTVAALGSYADLEHQGVWYRSKAASFERLYDLPRQAHQEMEIALRTDDQELPLVTTLRDGGWQVRNAQQLGGLDEYRGFIARSRAEIGVAQAAYVTGRSGWFSDRSVHYLLAGRPVLAQSTGFDRVLPTGAGLLSFDSPGAAIAGVQQINDHYELHARAARELAREYFDYRRVLPRLLEQCQESDR